MELLPKKLQDTLIIIRHNINRDVGTKREIDELMRKGFIEPKHGGGWLATGAGREYVRKLK